MKETLPQRQNYTVCGLHLITGACSPSATRRRVAQVFRRHRQTDDPPWFTDIVYRLYASPRRAALTVIVRRLIDP